MEIKTLHLQLEWENIKVEIGFCNCTKLSSKINDRSVYLPYQYPNKTPHMNQYTNWRKEGHQHKCVTTNMQFNCTNCSTPLRWQKTGCLSISNKTTMAEMTHSKYLTFQTIRSDWTYWSTDLSHKIIKLTTCGSMNLSIALKSNANIYFYNDYPIENLTSKAFILINTNNSLVAINLYFDNVN